ncbi:alpha-glucosidase [Carnobacterium maltaromaticum]|uniref:alpha-glucosidase n=1 Tax=Carnobacterium maltaromaticum TaxID=2751 RepID=UPI00107192CB|nr:alpha-glucosidase [Carnobacterium maltaromaticum]TFJ72801.1 alpha-glucosidase [Carnobacterium maltaromaticum]TFJ77548.1 alpha-glucosidase [Carnobacterium maltaromaticum]
MSRTNWWQSAIVYQIYPRSFQDTNNDGIGDIKGIIQRLDYIKSLGVNTIWLNPIFISPQIDNGYDISNYYGIDPIFGTLKDVQELIYEAHQRELKIIFDFVLNHTSDQHPWFQEALKGPDNLYRDYYLWADGKKNGAEPPNNWASFFGGSTWEKDLHSQQYYFHLFAKEMPDLNWENPEVHVALLDIAKFWLNEGIDGFRLDAFIHMAKEKGYPALPNPTNEKYVIAEEYYANLPKVQEYLAKFIQALREVKPDVFIVGEAASAEVKQAVEYTDPTKNQCDAVITFRYFPEREELKDSRLPLGMQPGTLDRQQFKQVMAEWQKEMASVGGPTLYWNNHDMPRVVSRFGDDGLYRETSSKMLATLMYLQKGLPFLLNGEEIGMKNRIIQSIKDYEDPGAEAFYHQALALGYTEIEALELLNASSKDASRGGMQWTKEPYSGFSTEKPWSSVNQEENYTVEAEEADEGSILHYYRRLLLLKKRELFTKGSFSLLETGDETFCYVRNWDNEEAVVLTNMTNEPVQLTCLEETLFNGKILLSAGDHELTKKQVTLAPYSCVVIQTKMKK